MTLQDQLDGVQKSIKTTERALAAGAPRAVATSLAKLKDLHRELSGEVDRLCNEVDVFHDLPEIRGHSVQFLHSLLRAWDAKRTCRGKLIGRFSEWDKLDAALGGKEPAMGTRRVRF